jgi:hypothetical protein
LLDGSSINILAVPYLIDRNGTGGIVDFVDDAAVALAHTIPVVETGKFL